MKTSLALTVTQLMHYDICPYRARLLYRLGCPTGGGEIEREEKVADRPTPLSAQDLGTVVHRLLELADFSQFEKSAEENMKKHFPSLSRAAAAAALKLAERWGKSELFKQARAAAALHRERTFLLSLDGGTLEGSIDLLFIGADKAIHVVDYKTSADHPEYRFQLQLYFWAAQRLWENRPVAGGLFFLEEGKFVPVSYPGPAAVAEKASRLAAGWRAGEFPARPLKETCARCTVRAVCSFRAV